MQDKRLNVKDIVIRSNVYIIFLLYLLLFTIVVTHFNNLPFIDGMIFVLFQVTAIILPGTGIVFIFIVNKSLSILELFIYSYISGYILNILIYFLLVPFQLQKGFFLIFLLLDCLAIIEIRKNFKNIYIPARAEIVLWTGFIFLLAIFILIIYCGNNLLPTALSENAYYTDLLFWSGDTIELSHNFPPQHFRNVNQSYFYHYFSSIQLAVIHIITSINVAELSLVFAPSQSIILLVSGVLLLFKELVKKRTYFYTLIGMTILFFTTGNELYTSVNYVSHMYKAPFGFDVSMAFGMFALLFFLKQFAQNNVNKFYYLMTILCFVICLGSKGPIGVAVLGLLGIICLYYFFIKKRFITALLYGCSLLAIFVLLTGFILISQKTSVASTLTLSNAYQRLANSGYIGDFFETLYSRGIPWIIARIMQIFYFAFICQYSIAIIFFVGIILKIVNYRKIDILDIACVAISFMGCILALIVGHPTYSQTYFMMAVYPYATLFGIKSFSDFEVECIQKNSILKKIAFIVQLFIFSIAISVGINSFTGCYYFNLGWNIGLANYQRDSGPALEVSKTPLYNYVSSSDYEAYVWIRENTKWQDLFTSNLCLDHEIVRPYCLGAFSERHILMEDITLIEKLMNNEKEAIRELRESAGINYIVYYKRISPKFNGKRLGLDCVFDNNSISIYHID